MEIGWCNHNIELMSGGGKYDEGDIGVKSGNWIDIKNGF